jgi:hypothetical protein
LNPPMPRVAGVCFCFHSVEVFFCPAGHERSLGLGVEPSPPTCLRVRPESATRREAPRRRREAAAPYPHDGQRVGCPHAPAQWLLWPAGRSQPPTLRLETLKPGMRTSCPTTSRACGPRAGVGVSSARRRGGHRSGGHGVPSVRSRGGVSVTRFLADTEGPRPGTHCWVVAGGVSARRESRLRRDEQAPRGRSPAGQNRPHAVKERSRPAASPPRAVHILRVALRTE